MSNAFEHTCYLSDGTKLSQAQYEELRRKGEIKLPNGRVIVSDLKFDYLFSQDVARSLKEKDVIS